MIYLLLSTFVCIAMAAGIGVGWAWRGDVEAQRSEDHRLAALATVHQLHPTHRRGGAA